jgi:hypothetical protein
MEPTIKSRHGERYQQGEEGAPDLSELSTVSEGERVQSGSNTEAVLRMQMRDLEERGLTESPAHERIRQVLEQNNAQKEGGDL